MEGGRSGGRGEEVGERERSSEPGITGGGSGLNNSLEERK